MSDIAAWRTGAANERADGLAARPIGWEKILDHRFENDMPDRAARWPAGGRAPTAGAALHHYTAVVGNRAHERTRRCARNGKMSFPDLQRLVELRGGYCNITAEDWTAWDLQNADWQRLRKEEFERLREHSAALVLKKFDRRHGDGTTGEWNGRGQARVRHCEVAPQGGALFPPAPGLAINVDVRVNGFSKSSLTCRHVATGPGHRGVHHGAGGLPVSAHVCVLTGVRPGATPRSFFAFCTPK